MWNLLPAAIVVAVRVVTSKEAKEAAAKVSGRVKEALESQSEKREIEKLERQIYKGLLEQHADALRKQ